MCNMGPLFMIYHNIWVATSGLCTIGQFVEKLGNKTFELQHTWHFVIGGWNEKSMRIYAPTVVITSLKTDQD